jgi:nicotinate-nucleotide pyrophosphorylase (carboxylating)
MLPPYVTDESINTFLKAAFLEDVGEGDHSSLAAIPEDLTDEAILLMKDHGIIAGVTLAQYIFSYYDQKLKVECYAKDGDSLKPGNHVLRVTGAARSILACERLVLNCMQRMSGIASYTHQLVNLIDHTSARLLDTRKTTPNFRMMEKWAVVIGGGTNHRFGLYDMIMLKDNHIDFAGGIGEAIEAAVNYIDLHKLSLKIEIETRNLEEVKQVLAHGKVDRIMLDNMTPEEMRKAVLLINGTCETEASGGITEDTISTIAETGVDYISVGALTHSTSSLDMSLKAIKHIKHI